MVPKSNWGKKKSGSHFYFPANYSSHPVLQKKNYKHLHLSTIPPTINIQKKNHSERPPFLKINDRTASIENLRKNAIKGTQECQNNSQKLCPVTVDKSFQKCYVSPISPSCCYPSVCDRNVRRATRDPIFCCCFLSCLQPLPNKSQSRKN